MAARTAAGHENTRLIPRADSASPTGELRPKTISKNKPTTVGGIASGNMSNPSITSRLRPLKFIRQRAAMTPITKVMTVEAITVFKEIHSGVRSIVGDDYTLSGRNWSILCKLESVSLKNLPGGIRVQKIEKGLSGGRIKAVPDGCRLVNYGRMDAGGCFANQP